MSAKGRASPTPGAHRTRIARAWRNAKGVAMAPRVAHRGPQRVLPGTASGASLATRGARPRFEVAHRPTPPKGVATRGGAALAGADAWSRPRCDTGRRPRRTSKAWMRHVRAIGDPARDRTRHFRAEEDLIGSSDATYQASECDTSRGFVRQNPEPWCANIASTRLPSWLIRATLRPCRASSPAETREPSSPRACSRSDSRKSDWAPCSWRPDARSPGGRAEGPPSAPRRSRGSRSPSIRRTPPLPRGSPPRAARRSRASASWLLFRPHRRRPGERFLPWGWSPTRSCAPRPR